MPECTCMLGRIDEHKRGQCSCTTTIMDCAVHADSDTGRWWDAEGDRGEGSRRATGRP